MITIDDEQRLLNLNYMAVYLMLTPEEIAKYGSKLKKLNSFRSLTRNIFHFEIVEKGNTPYDQLPEELVEETQNNNLFVRLVNSIHSIYCYGLTKIDFSLEPDELQRKLSRFVDDVCSKNILQLDIICNRTTDSAKLALKEYNENRIAKYVFERALNKELIHKNDMELSEFEFYSTTTEKKQSYEIMAAALTNEQISRIEKERCEREKPEVEPKISVTIKYVPTGKQLKNGKPKKVLGVEYTIDGDTVYAPLSSTDQAFLYQSVLMAKLDGKRLKRENFTEYANTEMKTWLRKRFAALAHRGDFDEWFNMVNKHGPAARINDAKPKINHLLWNTLSAKHKNAYYFCCLTTLDAHKSDTRYQIRIHTSNIFLDEDIRRRLE